MSTLKLNIIAQYGLQLAKYVFPLVTLPYLTRVLGADAFGVRAYILSYMTFMQVIAEFGFLQYGTREIAKRLENKKSIHEVVWGIVEAKAILLVLLSIATAVACVFIQILNENMVYTWIAFLSVVITVLLPDFVFMAYERMLVLTTRFVIAKGVSTALTFVLVHGPTDLIMVPLLDLVAAIITFGISWGTIAKDYKIPVRLVSFGGIVGFTKGSFYFFLANASSSVFNSFTTMVIGIMLDNTADVSYWSLAITCISVVQALYTPISNSLYPNMLNTRSINPFLKIIKPTLLLVALGSVLFVLLRNVLFLLIGGEEYVAGSFLLIYLAPVVFFSYPGILIGVPLLGGAGLSKDLMKSTLVAAIFNIISISILCFFSFFSLQNAAIIRSATELIMLLGELYFVTKKRRLILEYFARP